MLSWPTLEGILAGNNILRAKRPGSGKGPRPGGRRNHKDGEEEQQKAADGRAGGG